LIRRFKRQAIETATTVAGVGKVAGLVRPLARKKGADPTTRKPSTGGTVESDSPVRVSRFIQGRE